MGLIVKLIKNHLLMTNNFIVRKLKFQSYIGDNFLQEALELNPWCCFIIRVSFKIDINI